MSNKAGKVFDDLLNITGQTLFRMIEDFVVFADQIFYDPINLPWRNFKAIWADDTKNSFWILTERGPKLVPTTKGPCFEPADRTTLFMGPLPDIVNVTFETAGNDSVHAKFFILMVKRLLPGH